MHVLHSTMAPLLISFFLSLFLILSTHILQQTCFASEDTAEQDIPNCPSSFSYHCGNLSYSTLSYPFTDAPFPTKCSPYALHCNKNNDTIVSMFGIPNTTAQYQLLNITNHTIYLYRTNVENQQKNQDDCDFNTYTPFLKYPSFDPWLLFSKSFKILNDEAYVRCPNGSLPKEDKKHWNCIKDTVRYGPYTLDGLRARQMVFSSCYILPKINTTISIWYDVDSQCKDCAHQGGTCYNSPGSWTSMCLKKEEEKTPVKKKLIIILASVSGVAIVTLLVIILIVFWHQRKMKYISLNKPRYLGFPKSKDFEQGSVLFGVPVFSYDDLKDATENFNSTKELGEGGFGTVYHGILKDGREVAVKRLHEKTYKQIEQFLNELRILTCLHHKNLVTLYGCTSRHCRELLLVYEYVPNGTLADHLHGDKAASRSLTWPIRMAIAIETASALVYLHATDIIHRDVKTNNILLDKDFMVKVADFGLSRLFPIDVTHVSTAPQGTPGYVDPEYHHCYQLTDKSDVFSFGVVLVELISSLRAVDVNRYKHEINLSTYAMNRIQCGAFKELIDPNLGFDSDFKVERMTTLVSELAFQCLQQKSELRPSMEEVFEALKNIESADYNMLEAEVMGMKAEIGKASSRSSKPPSTPSEKDESEIFLRGVQLPTSPKSVMNKWMSKSVTPKTSC